MISAHTTIIKASKSKLTKLLLFSLIFLLIGLWILIKNPSYNNSFFYNPIVKAIAGYGGTIMGLIGLFFFTKKIFDKRPGVIIDEHGIQENVSIFNFGLIPWRDIQHVDEVILQVPVASKQQFVRIIVKNPEFYISSIKNPIKRRLAKANLSGYRSPITITTNWLKITHPELLNLIKAAYVKHQN